MCVQLHIDSNSSYPKQKGGLMKNAYFFVTWYDAFTFKKCVQV